MDVDKLHGLLADVTSPFYEGVTEDAGLAIVDCHFVVIGVDKVKAEARRGELVDLLAGYSPPGRLAVGPSYIEVGGVLGDQGEAFRLFAVGEALGMWKVITPKTMGFEGRAAEQLAGQGFVMMSGYKVA